MSVSLLLVPVSMAAVALWEKRQPQETGNEALQVCTVNTRMKDPSLLRSALEDTGAAVMSEGACLRAQWQDVRASFTRDDEHDGVWTAHLDGEIDEEQALAIIEAVDKAYGLKVQAAVIGRIEQQATTARMRVASRTQEEDSTVTLVLTMESGQEGQTP